MTRLTLTIIAVSFFMSPALARWKPQYAHAPINIKKWYSAQHNAVGQWCCTEADGHPYFGAYTLNKDGSVTLALKGGKRVIPSVKVLKGPNPTGHAVWWHSDGTDPVDYCFAPGTLT